MRDTILFHDDEMLITKWDALRPRPDFARGYSVCFPRKGWKVSWHIRADGSLLRRYIDIGDCVFDAATNSFTFHDLLLDVVILPDGAVRVLDVGELPEALDAGLIDLDMLKRALNRLDGLLAIIYGGRFEELCAPAMKYINL